jgi:hypothetical protein
MNTEKVDTLFRIPYNTTGVQNNFQIINTGISMTLIKSTKTGNVIAKTAPFKDVFYASLIIRATIKNKAI